MPHRSKDSGSFHIGSGRTLRTTAVFDSYWRFAHERQSIFSKRCAGQPPEWTSDPVLRAFRFTNVFRASDRVSQYLIRNVIYRGEQTEEEVFFRTILFKLFNKIETWEALEAELGEISWREFDHEHFNRVLDGLMEKGRRVYSAAYIMPSPQLGAKRKHTNHLLLLADMMRDGVPAMVATARSLSDVFELLRARPSFGGFLAFQFAIDLNYSTLTDFSEMDFVVAGPGAQSGIGKAFVDTAGLSNEDVIRAVCEHSEREFGARGLEFQGLWGRPLQLIDCQNLFCEVDKYARVVHPEVGASKRTKIKQRYSASRAKQIKQWYPPKWGLTPGSGSPVGHQPVQANLFA